MTASKMGCDAERRVQSELLGYVAKGEVGTERHHLDYRAVQWAYYYDYIPSGG